MLLWIAAQLKLLFTISFAVPPEFREKDYEQNLEVNQGDTWRLSCYVTGNPTPKVILYFLFEICGCFYLMLNSLRKSVKEIQRTGRFHEIYAAIYEIQAAIYAEIYSFMQEKGKKFDQRKSLDKLAKRL